MAVMNCENCGTSIECRYELRIVQVKQTLVLTTPEGGHAKYTEFAATYCALKCASEHLNRLALKVETNKE